MEHWWELGKWSSATYRGCVGILGHVTPVNDPGGQEGYELEKYLKKVHVNRLKKVINICTYGYLCDKMIEMLTCIHLYGVFGVFFLNIYMWVIDLYYQTLHNIILTGVWYKYKNKTSIRWREHLLPNFTEPRHLSKTINPV